ncbi:MAG TPA: hypothetical protein VEK08_24765 [Planctomycetota bacterium]|nr:hypothetical protein [Planctomycetota bacterium]
MIVRGFLLIEVIAALALTIFLIALAGGSVWSVQRSLELAAREEKQQENWAALSATLREDLRGAAALRWNHGAANTFNAILIVSPDGTQIQYASRQGKVVRSVEPAAKQSAAPQPREYAVSLAWTGAAQADAAAAELWSMKPVPAAEKLSLAKSPAFLMVQAELSSPGTRPRRVQVGAATRREAAP